MVRLAPIFSKYFSNTRPPFLESLILNAKTPFLKTKFFGSHSSYIYAICLQILRNKIHNLFLSPFFCHFVFVLSFIFLVHFFCLLFWIFILWNLYLKAQSVLCNILCLYNLVAVRIYCDDEKLYAYCFYKRNQIEKKKLKY